MLSPPIQQSLVTDLGLPCMQVGSTSSSQAPSTDTTTSQTCCHALMLTTYKAISKPLINYCAPIWTPTLCDLQWQGLKACKNSALRTALGCTKMTGADHLPTESLVMPAKAHKVMLSKQFHLKIKLADHPNKQGAADIPPNL